MRESDLSEEDNISYEVFTALEEIAEIASGWNSLLARSPCNRAFSCAQWFAASCRLHQDVRPYVIVARREERLAAILPLVLSNEETLASFPDEESDYNDLVAAPDDLTAMTGVLDHALTPGAGYRKLMLSRLRDDANCLRAALNLNPARDLSVTYSVETSCPYIRLPSGYDEYLLTRSRSFRTSLGQAHRYAARHQLSICELQPETFSAECLAELFLALHLTRFGEHSSLSLPMAQAFVREVVPPLFTDHRLRAFALYETEKIIAVSLCLVGTDSLCLWNGGFASGSERWSPGKLLISAGIRAACNSKLGEYDFLRGAEDYKSRWTREEREIGKLEFQIGH